MDSSRIGHVWLTISAIKPICMHCPSRANLPCETFYNTRGRFTFGPHVLDSPSNPRIIFHDSLAYLEPFIIHWVEFIHLQLFVFIFYDGSHDMIWRVVSIAVIYSRLSAYRMWWHWQLLEDCCHLRQRHLVRNKFHSAMSNVEFLQE